jgi:hypothetical protein
MYHSILFLITFHIQLQHILVVDQVVVVHHAVAVVLLAVVVVLLAVVEDRGKKIYPSMAFGGTM